jgi:hypothetical protein
LFFPKKTPLQKEENSIMRKSKAIAIIRKRKRNDGLAYRPNEGEHPLILAVKALTAFTEGTMILMRMFAEADDKEAMRKMMESEGLIKMHQNAADAMNKGMYKLNEIMEAHYNNK